MCVQWRCRNAVCERMMDKKGQITMFIIVGVFIVVMMSAMVVVRNKLVEKTKQVVAEKDDVSEVTGKVVDCIEDVSAQGVRKSAMQGGYVSLEMGNAYNEQGHDGGHGFLEGFRFPYLTSIRGQDVIKKKIANMVITDMNACLNLARYEVRGYKISKPVIDSVTSDAGVSVGYSDKQVMALVDFGQDTVLVNLVYPLLFERGEVRKVFTDFSAEIPVRFARMHASVEKFLAKMSDARKKEMSVYNLGGDCAEYASFDGLVNVYAVRIGEKDYLIQFIDAQPTVVKRGMPLKFQFGVKGVAIEGECVG